MKTKKVKTDYCGFELTDLLVEICDHWLEWKGYEDIYAYGDTEVLPHEDAETRIQHMEGSCGYEPWYLYENLYYRYLREFKITEERFLDFYFNTGADGDQRQMREDLGYEIVERLLEGNYTYTFNVRDTFDNCGYLRMDYCELEKGHPIEKFEDVDLDFEFIIKLVSKDGTEYIRESIELLEE